MMKIYTCDREQQDDMIDVGRDDDDDHRDNVLMPPPRNVFRTANVKTDDEDLLRAIAQGKVQCSLPSLEAVADWLRRRRKNIVRSEMAQPVPSKSSHLVTSTPPDNSSCIGASSSMTSITSCGIASSPIDFDDDHDVLEKSVRSRDGISSPVLSNQISQEVVPIEDSGRKKNHHHRRHHSAHYHHNNHNICRQDRKKDENDEISGSQNWIQSYSSENKLQNLKVHRSHQDTSSTAGLRLNDGNITEEDNHQQQKTDQQLGPSYRQHLHGGRIHSLKDPHTALVVADPPRCHFLKHLQRDTDSYSVLGSSQVAHDDDADDDGINVAPTGQNQRRDGDDDCKGIAAVHETTTCSSSTTLSYNCLKRKRSKIDDGRDEKITKSTSIPTFTSSFKNIIGHQAVKLRMEEVLLPLALPTSLAQSILKGIRSYSPSLLLYGPPGCGKVRNCLTWMRTHFALVFDFSLIPVYFFLWCSPFLSFGNSCGYNV
jgi:hypothetical protein